MGIVLFTAHGVWIHPVDAERFLFNGSPEEFLSIYIYHPELHGTFLVHVAGNEDL